MGQDSLLSKKPANVVHPLNASETLVVGTEVAE